MTDVRRERIPLLWSRARERTLAKGFSFNMMNEKCPCVCRRTRCCDRYLTICNLFWFGQEANEELKEEDAHDYVCVI